jgi:hypothetical protein
LCFLCSDDRTGALPFDIRNRSVIEYNRKQPDRLRRQVANRLRAILDDDHVILCQGTADHLPFIFPKGELREMDANPRYTLRDFEVRQYSGFALVLGTVVTSLEGHSSQGIYTGHGPVSNGYAYLQYTIADSEHRQEWAGLAIVKLAGFGNLEGYWLTEHSLIPGTVASGYMTLKRTKVSEAERGAADRPRE